MDKRVEELVEKVARHLHRTNEFGVGANETWEIIFPHLREHYRNKAKQILFNNNLAMVTHQFGNVFSTKQDKLARVIPLTEVV